MTESLSVRKIVLQCLLLWTWHAEVLGQHLTFNLNGVDVKGDVYCINDCAVGTPATLSCVYINSDAESLYHSAPVMYRDGTDAPLVTTTNKDTLKSSLVYAIPESEAQGSPQYRCLYESDIGSTIRVRILFDYSVPPTTTAPISTLPPSTLPPSTLPPSTLPPSTPPNTDPSATAPPTMDQLPGQPGGNGPSNFSGLNPLIYTVAAVLLLGTLAIVAIVTCWVRARRTFNNRMMNLRLDTNPLEYLDYINDNEFTPLTTSEFMASLQSRPPTYNESEDFETRRRSLSSVQGSETQPPALPPPPSLERAEGRGDDDDDDDDVATAQGPGGDTDSSGARGGGPAGEASGGQQRQEAMRDPSDVATEQEIQVIQARVDHINERMSRIRELGSRHHHGASREGGQPERSRIDLLSLPAQQNDPREIALSQHLDEILNL